MKGNSTPPRVLQAGAQTKWRAIKGQTEDPPPPARKHMGSCSGFSCMWIFHPCPQGCLPITANQVGTCACSPPTGVNWLMVVSARFSPTSFPLNAIDRHGRKLLTLLSQLINECGHPRTARSQPVAATATSSPKEMPAHVQPDASSLC